MISLTLRRRGVRHVCALYFFSSWRCFFYKIYTIMRVAFAAPFPLAGLMRSSPTSAISSVAPLMALLLLENTEHRVSAEILMPPHQPTPPSASQSSGAGEAEAELLAPAHEAAWEHGPVPRPK
jgi:hypothetical protein